MFLSNNSSLFRYTLIAGLALSFVGCKDEEEPEPRIGSIYGMVDPEAVEKVRVLNTANQEVKSVTPSANGSFNVGNLPAGDYTVKVMPFPGWGKPADIKVPVTGNVSSPIGMIEVNRNAFITYKVGVDVIADSGAISALFQTTSKTLSFGNETVVAGVDHDIFLSMKPFTNAAGDFSLAQTTGNENTAAYSSNGGSQYVSQSGNIKITSYDATHRLVSGTFTFVGKQFGGSTEKIVSEGQFRDVYIQD